jgi:hypothetical protein
MNANFEIPPFLVTTPHPADGEIGSAGAHELGHNAIFLKY